MQLSEILVAGSLSTAGMGILVGYILRFPVLGTVSPVDQVELLPAVLLGLAALAAGFPASQMGQTVLNSF